jgi:hypothetical protein
VRFPGAEQIVGSAATIGTKKINVAETFLSDSKSKINLSLWLYEFLSEYLGGLGHIIILVGLSMLMSPTKGQPNLCHEQQTRALGFLAS